jgi:hypothetical protein
LAVLAPRHAGAQAPLADEWIVNSNISSFESPNSVACDALADCAISWQQWKYDASNNFLSWMLAKSFGPHGEVLAEREIRFYEASYFPYVVGLPRGFTVLWSETIYNDAYPLGYATLMSQIFDEGLASAGGMVSTQYQPPMYQGTAISVGRLPDGYVVLASGKDIPNAPPGTYFYFVRLNFDSGEAA